MNDVTRKLPSSVEVWEDEVEKEGRDDFISKRWIYIHELKALLERFEDTDYLEVNQVGNLNVHKNDGFWLGTIELLWVRFTDWSEEEE